MSEPSVPAPEMFRRHYWIPHQLVVAEPRLHDMIWDEVLREAHKSGVIPVGPILVRKATSQEREDQLKKEHPFKRTEIALGGEILYIGEVLIGTALQ